MKQNKWYLTKINKGFEMTRVSGNNIECRKLNWIERIIYFRKINKLYIK